MAVSNASLTTISGLFKRKYGNLSDLLPKGFPLLEMAGFTAAGKAGESLQVAVQLSHENGISLAGSAGDVINFNDAQSGIVKQAKFVPAEMFLSTGIVTSALARAASSEQSFEMATKNRVAANLKSHMRFTEHLCYYGQDDYGVGRVSYLGGDFRGITFTAGAGTLGGVILTAGVNTTSKNIMISPEDIASGLFIGAEGLEIEQIVTAGGAIAGAGAAKGKIVAVDIRNGIIKVDFTPVAATGVGSHHLKLKGQSSALDMIGAKKILANTGSLFDIDAAVYSMWAGNSKAIVGKLTFAKLVDVIEAACDMGLDRDVEVHVPFESWGDLLQEQAALRSYDSSYDASKAENGAKKIEFHFVNGLIRVVPSRFVRRSEAFVFAVGDWSRIGASDIGLKVPGSDDGDLITPPISSNVYVFRSYSNQQIMCAAPRRSILLTGINPEALS